MAKKLIANITKKFDISAYKNEYKERVVKAIEDKIAGQKIQVVKSPKPKKVINLLDALKQSVEQTDNDDDEKVVSFRKRA